MSEETGWLLRGRAEGIAEEWKPRCNMAQNPALPLDHEFEDDASRDRERLLLGPALFAALLTVFTLALHAAPFTQPTQPGDITGFALWFVCTMMALIPAMFFTGISGPLIDARYRKADKDRMPRYYALPAESARWVLLFQRESKAVLELDPEPDLYFLVQDAREQVRLWQLRLIEAAKEDKLADQASLETALRTAAIDMTHLRLSLEKQEQDSRAVYEAALVDTPVNIGAQARAIEASTASTTLWDESLLGDKSLLLEDLDH